MSTTIHDAQTSHVYRFMCNFQLASSDSAQQDLQALSAKQDTLISTRTMRSIGIVEYLTMLQACARLRPNLMFLCGADKSANRRLAASLYWCTTIVRANALFLGAPGGYPVCIQPSARAEYRASSFFSSFKLPTVEQ
jgi:hypothetical protein